ncbi:unnamed protein product [Linum trigynum]|uniref:Uncharacterized protein n=1 Tax=Linum trigynum TaxID=586398 RepID=A0AAV2E5J8_9ROSI
MRTLTNFQYGFKLTREDDGRLYFTTHVQPGQRLRSLAVPNRVGWDRGAALMERDSEILGRVAEAAGERVRELQSADGDIAAGSGWEL